MEFSAWLLEQMTTHHYNQTRLALELRIGQSTVSNWLQGKSGPEVENVVALSELFKYDLLSLIEIAWKVKIRGPNVPTGVEQQVVDRLRLLRGEPQYDKLAQLFIQTIDIVLSAKDGLSEEFSGEPKEERPHRNRI